MQPTKSLTPKTNHVFVIVRPGHPMDGEQRVFHGTEAEAMAEAKAFGTAYVPYGGEAFELKKIGTRSFGKFTPCVPVSELPFWAALEIA